MTGVALGLWWVKAGWRATVPSWAAPAAALAALAPATLSPRLLPYALVHDGLLSPLLAVVLVGLASGGEQVALGAGVDTLTGTWFVTMLVAHVALCLAWVRWAEKPLRRALRAGWDDLAARVPGALHVHSRALTRAGPGSLFPSMRHAALLAAAVAIAAASGLACRSATVRPRAAPSWETANPVVPLPVPPLGAGEVDFAKLGVTPEKVRLGRWLFYDARLSVDGTVSCATCHRPEHAFSEPLRVSKGVGGKLGTRKAPTVINLATPVAPVFFWDGRATSLAEQAKGPIENTVEMANTHAAAAAAIAGLKGYRPYFGEVFGDDRIDIDRIATALAAYEMTRFSGNSAFDRFDAGDETALSPLAQEGRDIFFGTGRCNACHLGPNFTDAKFHNIGVGFEWGIAATPLAKFADLGRYVVTNVDRDRGAFKTPTLRDLTKRAPYMHDGSIATLDEAVFLYVRGGNLNPWLAPEMEEVRVAPWQVPALVAFLESLEGTGYEDTAPAAFPQ